MYGRIRTWIQDHNTEHAWEIRKILVITLRISHASLGVWAIVNSTGSKQWVI